MIPTFGEYLPIAYKIFRLGENMLLKGVLLSEVPTNFINKSDRDIDCLYFVGACGTMEGHCNFMSNETCMR